MRMVFGPHLRPLTATTYGQTPHGTERWANARVGAWGAGCVRSRAHVHAYARAMKTALRFGARAEKRDVRKGESES